MQPGWSLKKMVKQLCRYWFCRLCVGVDVGRSGGGVVASIHWGRHCHQRKGRTMVELLNYSMKKFRRGQWVSKGNRVWFPLENKGGKQMGC